MKAQKRMAWVESRIGDVAELFSGSTPSSTDPTLWGGDILWLAPSDITALQESSVVINDTPTKITQRGYDSCSTKLLPPGTVCVSSRATVGDCIILGQAACTNQGFINVVCTEELDPCFFLYWVRQNKRIFLRLAAGTTFDEIGRRSFRNIRFSRPKDVAEQQAIGATLRLVDSEITATILTIEAAERLQQGVMNEMLVGRMRPDGAIRDHSEFFLHAKVGKLPFGWKVERLRDLFRLKNGKSNITANLRDVSGDEFCFPVFGGNGMTGWSNRYFLPDETIVIGRVGEYCGAIHATPPRSWVTDNALYIEERLCPLDVRFLFHLLKSLRLNRWKATTGQPKITQSEILNIRVALPESEVEQWEIVSRIDDLEKVIDAKRAKINALQRLKKSLMQNLLTNHMRLSPEAIAELTAEAGKSGGA